MRLRVANSIVMVVERTATAKTRTQCLNVEVGGAAVGLLERGLIATKQEEKKKTQTSASLTMAACAACQGRGRVKKVSFQG